MTTTGPAGKQLNGWNHWPPDAFKGCPDCGSEEFYEGPCGGMAQNMKCAGCGHKFNFCGPFGVDRLEDGRTFPVGTCIVYSEEVAPVISINLGWLARFSRMLRG